MNYGNLAYELPQRYIETPEKTAPARKPINKKNVYKKERARADAASKARNMRRIAAITAVALSAGFMISQFVRVSEVNSEVASLQKELTALESQTSQMVYEMERSVDLTEIEKEATTRLGMQRPEKYQMIYVNVKQDDMTDKTAGEVEGLWNRAVSAAKKIGSNIAQFFSIK